jgi:hypothetical protein
MNTHPPQQPDPALQAFYADIVQNLVTMLPPPIDNMSEDSGSSPAVALARRDRAAIALLASLAPANAAEAMLAVQYVAAGAHATYCLSQVREHPPASDLAMKLRTQFASLEREAQRTRSRLLKMQEARYKREAANRAARPPPPRHSVGQGAGGGLATQGGPAVTPPLQPPAPSEALVPAPPEAAKPAPPRHSPPALRIIQGGLAN